MMPRRRALRAFSVGALCSLPAYAQPATPAAPPTAGAAPTASATPAPAPTPPATPPATSAAPPAPAPASDGDLQSPEQVSTRYSAYSLPQGKFAFEGGALGIGSGDVFATLGAAYGIGAGLQVSMNIAHASVAMFNLKVNWHFIDTRYFDLGASVGAVYGHGDWFWIAQGVSKEVISKLDVINVPIGVTASSQLTRWLELDLGLQYTYANLYGSTTNEDSPFSDAQLGLRQLVAQPGARLFVSDNTALEFFAKLPMYGALPRESGDDIKVPFSETWAFESGLRSRFARGLFGSVRLHYGAVVNALYGARLYPSFEVEFRP
jgi:hypothetical protein